MFDIALVLLVLFGVIGFVYVIFAIMFDSPLTYLNKIERVKANSLKNGKYWPALECNGCGLIVGVGVSYKEIRKPDVCPDCGTDLTTSVVFYHNKMQKTYTEVAVKWVKKIGWVKKPPPPKDGIDAAVRRL